jgi:hypothetical protein
MTKGCLPSTAVVAFEHPPVRGRYELRSRAHTVGGDLKLAEPTQRVFPLIWQARQAVDPALQVLAYAVPPAGPGAQIWQPTAVRTSFEGPEGCRT